MSTHNQQTRQVARKLTIHDIRKENAESVFVRNNASRIHKKPTTILIDHVHQGRTSVIEVPDTFIPIDLSLYIPKDQLLENPSFMSQVARGVIDLIATDAAMKELTDEVAIVEQDRIRAMMEKRYPELMGDGNLDMRALNDEQAQRMNSQTLGDANPDDMGVSAPVMEAISRTDMNDVERVALIRNLASVMTDKDRDWVRKNTNDQAVLAAIAG